MSVEKRDEAERAKCDKYSIVFSSKEGLDVLADLKNFCQVDGLCFHENPRTEAFMLGARSVALYIEERISGKSLKRLHVGTEKGVSDKSVKIDMGEKKEKEDG